MGLNTLPTIAIVTSPTRLQGLLARWGTVGQARFLMKQAVAHRNIEQNTKQDASRRSKNLSSAKTDAESDFSLYEYENDIYQETVERLRKEFDFGLPLTLIERRFLPTFEFRNVAVVVVVGPDGLVANAAKYVGDLPIVGVNPDPNRIDGILLPFRAANARSAVDLVLANKYKEHRVTMAEARLGDGQSLLAFNDLFIGRRTHVSARYNIRFGGKNESQSSSGVIVATGAGSTGWLSSVFNMARGIGTHTGQAIEETSRMAWSEKRLTWVVREPYASRFSQAEMVIGNMDEGQELVLESLMPEGGAIFSDGIESDFIEFNSGTTVRIRVANQQARIVVPGSSKC